MFRDSRICVCVCVLEGFWCLGLLCSLGVRILGFLGLGSRALRFGCL